MKNNDDLNLVMNDLLKERFSKYIKEDLLFTLNEKHQKDYISLFHEIIDNVPFNEKIKLMKAHSETLSDIFTGFNVEDNHEWTSLVRRSEVMIGNAIKYSFEFCRTPENVINSLKKEHPRFWMGDLMDGYIYNYHVLNYLRMEQINWGFTK